MVGISCGGVWATDDGCETWSPRTKGMRATFMPPERAEEPQIQDPHRLARCAAQPDVLWCQHHCGAWRSTDAGRSWTELKIPPSSFGFAVAAHPKNPDVAWFVPAQSDERRVPIDARVVVARTRDGGRTFDVISSGLPSPAFDLIYRHALDVDSTGDRLAMGSTTGSLWTSEDGGGSFKLVSAHLPPIFAVRFAP
jgi:hypothetical protein